MIEARNPVKEDVAEYKVGWESIPDTPEVQEKDDFAEATGEEGKDDADEKVQVADATPFRGDGVMTIQAHQRYEEATGERMDGSKRNPEPVKQEASYKRGEDGQIEKDWKARNASAQDEEGVQRLMKLRGITRQQAESEIRSRSKAGR